MMSFILRRGLFTSYIGSALQSYSEQFYNIVFSGYIENMKQEYTVDLFTQYFT